MEEFDDIITADDELQIHTNKNNVAVEMDQDSRDDSGDGSLNVFSKKGEKWKRPPTHICSASNIVNTRSGPATHVSTDTIQRICKHFFDNEIIYINQKGKLQYKKLKGENPSKKPKHWVPTFCEEIYTLVGFVLVAGAHKANYEQVNMSWSTTPKTLFLSCNGK